MSVFKHILSGRIVPMQQIFLCGVTNDFEVTTQETNNLTDIDVYEVDGNYQYDVEGLYSFETHLELTEWLSGCVNALTNHFEINDMLDEDIDGLTAKNLSLLNLLYQSIPADKKIKLCPNLIDIVFEGIVHYSNYDFTTIHDLIDFLNSCVSLMKAIVGNEMSLEFA